jgi:hypothetical protein
VSTKQVDKVAQSPVLYAVIVFLIKSTSEPSLTQLEAPVAVAAVPLTVASPLFSAGAEQANKVVATIATRIVFFIFLIF